MKKGAATSKNPLKIVRAMVQDGWRAVTAKDPLDFAPPSINDLIVRCCSADPDDRPASFAEILSFLSGPAKSEVE